MAAPGTVQETSQPIRGQMFRGMNAFMPAERLPSSDVQLADNMWIIAGELWTRPGKKALFTKPLPNPIYALTAYAASNGAMPPVITTWLMFVSGGKLYMAQAGQPDAPVEILNGGVNGGSSFSLNTATVRMQRVGAYMYIVDGVNPLYKILISYNNPTSAYVATQYVGLTAPTFAFSVALTNRVIDTMSNASLWSSYPALSWPGTGSTGTGTIGAANAETINNMAVQEFANGTESPSPDPQGWVNGGDSQGYQAAIYTPGLEVYGDAGAGPSWVDYDYPTPTYPYGQNTINNARVWIAGAFAHSGTGGVFGIQVFPEDASIVPVQNNTAISNATNATPIVVTAANHGFVTGENVTIAGVLGNTATNGAWQITVIDVNTFSIPTTGNGAFTRATISGATNANPIVVTAAAHGLTTGQIVTISGVVGNTAANGTWIVTVTGANTFSIPATGNGSYTSGGVISPPVLATGPTRYTDIVVVSGGANPSTISSAAHKFQATGGTNNNGDVYKIITIFGGTNFTPGNYTITAVNATTGVATVNGNIGVTGASGGVGALALDSAGPPGNESGITDPTAIGFSGIVGADQTSPVFKASVPNESFSNVFSFSSLSQDFSAIKMRLITPAAQSGAVGINTASLKPLDVRILLNTSSTGTLHLAANNPVNIGGNCLGGVWIKRDYTGTQVARNDLAIANSNALQVMSAETPFTSDDIGKTLSITGGVDWMVGIPIILDVVGGVATLSFAAATSTTATDGSGTTYSTMDFSQSGTLSVPYTAPTTSGQIPFRFGFLQPGQPLTAISWSNSVTYTTDGTAFYCDCSTIASTVRAQTGYLFLQIVNDLPATTNLADLCTLGGIFTSGNLTLHELYGGWGGDYSYQWTKINASNDPVFFIDVVESDPSPMSTPPIQPNGVSNQSTFSLPTASSFTDGTTHLGIYRFGGVFGDGYGRLIGRVSLSQDTAFTAGGTIFPYDDLSIIVGSLGTQMTSVGRPFISADVGLILEVSLGTGFYPGTYQVTSVSDGVATFNNGNTVMGIDGSTGGSGTFVQVSSSIQWNHSTGVFVDNTTDSSLEVNIPTFLLSGRTPLPVGATCLTEWQSHMVAAIGSSLYVSWAIPAGNNTGLYFNTVNVSDPNDIAQSVKGAYFDTGGADNDPIQALVPLGPYLIVWKQRSIFLLTGVDAASFSLLPHTLRGGLGLTAPLASAVIGFGAWFLAPDGVYSYDGTNDPTTTSTDIRPLLNPSSRNLPSLNPAAYAASFMVWHGQRLYLCAPGSAGDLTPTVIYVYDSESVGPDAEGGWVRWTEMNFTSAASLTQSTNTDDLYFAGQDGQIYSLNGTGDTAVAGGQSTGITVNFLGRKLGQETVSTFGAEILGPDYFNVAIPQFVQMNVVSQEDVTLHISVYAANSPRSWTSAYQANNTQVSLRLPVDSSVQGINCWVGLQATSLTPIVLKRIALELSVGSPTS